MSNMLFKKHFITARDCSKKLVYAMRNYPSTSDGNAFVKQLSEGGFQMGYIAQLMYPGGIEVRGRDFEARRLQTLELLKQPEVVLFEAALASGQKACYSDILIRQGESLHLVEVKSIQLDTEGFDPKKEKKYLEDVAFQYSILRDNFPGLEIRCYLMAPNKTWRSSINSLPSWFNSTEANLPEVDGPALSSDDSRRAHVVLNASSPEERAVRIHKLRSEQLLTQLDVTGYVIDMLPKIEERANSLLRIMNQGISDDDYCIGFQCKKCEFRDPDGLRDGYSECWGENANISPCITELYYGSDTRTKTGRYIRDLISVGKLSLLDIDSERFRNLSKDPQATRARRQLIQIEKTRAGEEWISPGLKALIRTYKYPLHFIDFETYAGALPLHEGMHPYEKVAFQWSCHSIESPGAAPVHHEWLHTGEWLPSADEFPNFEFACSLRACIGDTGTCFMWSTFEKSVMALIGRQLIERGINDPGLIQWVDLMSRDAAEGGRWHDMDKMTLDHYFHPKMKGQTSIKATLPAIWSSHPYLHQIDWFRDYVSAQDGDGGLNPYQDLHSDDEGDEVSGGTDAMRAYYDIRFNPALSGEQREMLRKDLLRYCGLDTMAMVIVATHWWQLHNQAIH